MFINYNTIKDDINIMLKNNNGIILEQYELNENVKLY